MNSDLSTIGDDDYRKLVDRYGIIEKCKIYKARGKTLLCLSVKYPYRKDLVRSISEMDNILTFTPKPIKNKILVDMISIRNGKECSEQMVFRSIKVANKIVDYFIDMSDEESESDEEDTENTNTTK